METLNQQIVPANISSPSSIFTVLPTTPNKHFKLTHQNKNSSIQLFPYIFIKTQSTIFSSNTEINPNHLHNQLPAIIASNDMWSNNMVNKKNASTLLKTTKLT